MKVIGYVRVSTEEQSQHGVSLAAQEQKLRQYAELYDLDLVEIIVDAGVSAKSLNRSGIQKALGALESGTADGVVICKLDRLCRSVADWGTLIDRYFAKKFAMLSVADQIDTRSASGRMGLNILMSVAQWEREIIGERTSAALQFKKSQGVILGAPCLKDAKAINRMVELRRGGATYEEISNTLTLEGHGTLRGGRWAKATVRKVLLRVGLGWRLGVGSNPSPISIATNSVPSARYPMGRPEPVHDQPGPCNALEGKGVPN